MAAPPMTWDISTSRPCGPILHFLSHPSPKYHLIGPLSLESNTTLTNAISSQSKGRSKTAREETSLHEILEAGSGTLGGKQERQKGGGAGLGKLETGDLMKIK